jgi:hypothetical protein
MDFSNFDYECFLKFEAKIKKVSAIAQETYAEPAVVQGAYAEQICIKN